MAHNGSYPNNSKSGRGDIISSNVPLKAIRDLKDLVDKGILTVEGPWAGRGIFYYLKGNKVTKGNKR